MQIKKSYITILELFRKDIFLSKTMRELAIMANKDYPIVYNTLKELEKNKIIKIKKIGNSNVCEFSFSYESISIMSFLDEQHALSKNIPNINKILEFKDFLDDILLVTGSYAKEKQNKSSDIDLVIITKENAFNKQKLIENLTSLYLPKIHAFVITQKDFKEMLLDSKANFGKEMFKSRLLFKNTFRYYELLKEAIENGFRG